MRILYIFLGILAFDTTLAQSTFHSGLEAGSYSVGYKVLQYEVKSRNYGTRPRPLNISLWYPAKAEGERLHFADYLNTEALINHELSIAEARKLVVGQLYSRAKRNGASEEALDQLLQLPTLALKKAPREPGQFPLVIVVQGGWSTGLYTVYPLRMVGVKWLLGSLTHRHSGTS